MTIHREQALVKCVRLFIWLNAQFLLEDGNTGVIVMECGGAVAIEGMELHQTPVGSFVQWVKTEQPLRIANAGVILALMFM